MKTTSEYISAALKGEDVSALWEQENPAIGQEASSDDEESDSNDAEPTLADDQEQETDQAADQGQEAKAEDSGNFDYVQVTGKDGQKQKLKINFDDKDDIKKKYSMAYGARKWQAERDQATKSLAETQKQLGELKEVWEKLDSAYKSGSSPVDRFASLIDFLESKQGAGSQVLEDYYKRRSTRETASPSQLKEWEVQESQSKRDQELARKDQELSKLREEQTKFMDEMRSKEANTLVQPVFEKFSFEGKLGDAEEESLLNETLWNQTVSRLEQGYPEGHSFSREELIKEFKQTHEKLNKLIKGRVDKEVTKVVNKQKATAKTTVQNVAKKNYSSSAMNEEAQALVNKGDFSGLFGKGNLKRFFK